MKALLPMDVKPPGSVTELRLEHPLKASPASSVTPAGMTISVRDEHSEKAWVLIRVRLEGRAMETRFAQPLKAPNSRLVMLSGSVTLAYASQSYSAHIDFGLMACGIVLVVRALPMNGCELSRKAGIARAGKSRNASAGFFAKAPSPTAPSPREDGRVTDANALHSLKANRPISRTEDGMVTAVRFAQPKKAHIEILLNFDGKAMERRPVPSKAEMPMVMTLSGMVTDVSDLQPTKARACTSVASSAIETWLNGGHHACALQSWSCCAKWTSSISILTPAWVPAMDGRDDGPASSRDAAIAHLPGAWRAYHRSR